MEAGRELDRLVAEKVMGLSFDSLMVLNPTDHPWTVPHYSTNIAAAWEIVRHFDTDKWTFDLTLTDPSGSEMWCAAFLRWNQVHPFYRGYDPKRYAATAPFAICLAALNAVEAEADGMAHGEIEETATH